MAHLWMIFLVAPFSSGIFHGYVRHRWYNWMALIVFFFVAAAPRKSRPDLIAAGSPGSRALDPSSRDDVVCGLSEVGTTGKRSVSWQLRHGMMKQGSYAYDFCRKFEGGIPIGWFGWSRIYVRMKSRVSWVNSRMGHDILPYIYIHI